MTPRSIIGAVWENGIEHESSQDLKDRELNVFKNVRGVKDDGQIVKNVWIDAVDTHTRPNERGSFCFDVMEPIENPEDWHFFRQGK